MTIIVIQSIPGASGGGDVTPSNTFAWGDLTVTSGDGIENNAGTAQVFAGINSSITVRAAWTSTSSNPTKGQWIHNGAPAQAPQLSPVEATIVLGDSLYWQTYAAYTHPAGNYDTGTVTVTNQSDAGAPTLDTFTFACQYVRTGTGGNDYLEPPLIPQ